MTTPRHIFWICLFLITLTPFLQAQDSFVSSMHEWSVEDGMPHREVNDIVQDSLGFIWIGTPLGIASFDGTRFKTYSTQTDSFLQENIWRIYPEANGCFWLFPPKPARDIDIWCPRTKKRTTFREHYGPDTGPEFLSELEIIESGQDHALLINDPKGRTIWRFHSDQDVEKLPYPKVQKLRLIAESATLWGLADDRQIIQFDRKGRILRTWEYESHVELQEAKISVGLPQQFRVKNDSGHFDLYQIDEHSGINHIGIGNACPLFIKSSQISSIREDLYIHPHNDSLHLSPTTPIDPSRIFNSKKLPRVTYLDQAGNVWIGNNFGLRVLEISRTRFRQQLIGPSDDQESFHAARGMVLEGDELFVNIEHKGLVRLNLKSGHEKWFNIQESHWGHFGLIQLHDGRLMSGANQRVYVQLSNRHDFNKIPIPVETWAFHQLDSDQVWLGTDQGLWLFNLHQLQAHAIDSGDQFPELSQARILQIVPHDNDTYWLCTNRGLFLINAMGQSIARYGRHGSGRLVLPLEDIRFIHPNQDNTFWLATGGGGLIHFAPREKEPVLRQMTMEDGLSSQTIHAILPDRFGNFWLPSDHGIMKLDLNRSNINTYLKGVAHPECNRLAFATGQDGKIYIGSINGITAFDPKDFQGQYDLPDPRMVVTRFEQFDGDISKLIDRTAQLDQTGIIELKPSDRFFRLEFTLLNLTNKGLNHYAYRLEGLDREWQYGRENILRFGRPPYGHYLLRIRGQDESGNWSSHELQIQVNVEKPIWLQTWFLGLTFLLLIVLIGGFIRWRTLQMKKNQMYLQQLVDDRTNTIRDQNIKLVDQAERLQHLDEVKSKLFANVSHELRTPLTLIMGPISSVLKSGDLGGRHDALLRNAQRGGQKLLSLINEILDLSKMESGMMTLNECPVHIYSFIRRIVSQFESIARLQSIHLIFESSLDNQLVLLVDAEKLEKVINNYLSNAFRHSSPGGSVTLHVKEEDARICIVVSDTGQGIHPDEMDQIFDRYFQSQQPEAAVLGGTGIGLALVKEYAQLFKGVAWAESVYGEGSAFYFSFSKKESFDHAEAFEPITIDSIEPVVSISDSSHSSSLLIVEDNPSLREYLGLVLQEEYQLIAAAHGQEALDRLEEFTPDLILSDIMMPVMDGYQLIKHLKSSDKWCGIPLIMLTARADIKDKLRALRIGVDDYLIKPFDESELKARIRNLLSRVTHRTPDALVTLSDDNSQIDQMTRPVISKEDMEWLGELESMVMNHLSEDDLTADRLGREIALSRRQLFRRIKELTGMTPNEYINEVRFREARRHLEDRTYNTVKSVAHAVGFRDPPYFSKQFQARFGKRPSEYLQG